MPSAYLQALATRYPNPAAVLAEIANLEAILTLPKPTVHVISDVHGEYEKLRHVVNNASGSLRPFVERLFAGQLDATQITSLLNLFYYPREKWQALTTGLDEAGRRALLLELVPLAITVIGELARGHSLKHVERVIPDPFDALIQELVFAKDLARRPEFVARLIEPFVRHGRDGELIRLVAHVVRNLTVDELIVAGDLGDRGPRIDKVIELLIPQPSIAITWGNHDAEWMAACLGHPAAIATVVRVSLRYGRDTQLEEGYGIALAPLERLARTAYGDDPCERFACKGESVRDPLLMARMQKAAAILQFKVEGALFRRRTDWELAHRALLDKIDPVAKTVAIDGTMHALLDSHLPTIDWARPYELTADEATCLAALTDAFTSSNYLWKHMSFVVSRGGMSLRRDLCAIFHGCVPVDDAGEFLSFPIDGVPYRGKALFDAIELVVQRAFRTRAMADIDLLYYLWTGPRSPCFGKDRMATFETYFVADKHAQEETKNPYFKLIHDAAFCGRILAEFGVDPTHGFIVNGHVPVKLEKGETPLKKSGRAITIDGAFAAAYGDKGFSLVLDAERLYLALHHHFDSVDSAVHRGVDIVPTITELAVYDRPRTVGDTEIGGDLRAEIAILEELLRAYDTNTIRAIGPPG